MERILDLAAYIIKRYKEIAEETLDEMKLHKLLYFTQREALAITGEPAFEESFEGWKYGPVSRDVRNAFFDGEILVSTKDIADGLKYITNNVILEYGSLASWRLSQMSHEDTSWRNARKGLLPGENGNTLLRIEDIAADAAKVRPYDHVWDMYYDEFENVGCGD